jgi:hypothetical protein
VTSYKSPKYRVLLLAAILVVGTVAEGSAANRRKKELKEDLSTVYTLTKTSIDELRVTRPGTVLVIQQDGIAGNPSSEVTNVKTVVENGQIRQARGPFAALTAKKSTRIFSQGERVYMTHVYVGSDNVMFDISSVDTHDINISGSTKQVRYNGTVMFRFPPDQFQSMSAGELKAAIDPFLQLQGEADQPKTIEIGQSIADIEGMLGSPERIVKAVNKTIYIYPDLKITFVDGRVSDVE